MDAGAITKLGVTSGELHLGRGREELCKKRLLIGDKKKRCHPEAGEARRGTPQLQAPLPRKVRRALTDHAECFAKVTERLGGPSACFASLGMTRCLGVEGGFARQAVSGRRRRIEFLSQIFGDQFD